MRIMVIPGPRDVLRLVSRTWQVAEQLVGMVPRLAALLDTAEEVVRILRTIDDAELRIADAVDKTLSIVDRIEPIVVDFEPTLRLLHPLLRRLVETTDPTEVEALVRLVDDLPQLVAKLHADVLPVLTTLGSMPDDLRELLIMSKELNEIIATVPGLSRMRQKALRELAAQEQQARERERLDGSAPAGR